jgi:hypothetical protein
MREINRQKNFLQRLANTGRLRNESRAMGHTNLSVREIPTRSDGFGLFFGV